MTDPTYADRLRETLALKLKLRNAFTSTGLIEDNGRRSAGRRGRHQRPGAGATPCVERLLRVLGH